MRKSQDDTQVFRWWVIQEESTGRRTDLSIKMFSTLNMDRVLVGEDETFWRWMVVKHNNVHVLNATDLDN